MLPVARWMMRGTPQAVAGAAAATLVPWLFWLGAAIAGLVTLRRGLAPAMPVIIAAALPAGWWWTRGDVIPLACTLLVTLMAVVLRSRMRWSETLVVGALAGAAMIQLGIFLPPAARGPCWSSCARARRSSPRCSTSSRARGSRPNGSPRC